MWQEVRVSPRFTFRLLLYPLLCLTLVAWPEPSAAATLVTDCTRDALQNALNQPNPGTITFSCGTASTLAVGTPLTVGATSPVIIDGGGVVVLDGGNLAG